MYWGCCDVYYFWHGLFHWICIEVMVQHQNQFRYTLHYWKIESRTSQTFYVKWNSSDQRPKNRGHLDSLAASQPRQVSWLCRIHSYERLIALQRNTVRLISAIACYCPHSISANSPPEQQGFYQLPSQKQPITNQLPWLRRMKCLMCERQYQLASTYQATLSILLLFTTL